jgi:hypothetical protein
VSAPTGIAFGSGLHLPNAQPMELCVRSFEHREIPVAIWTSGMPVVAKSGRQRNVMPGLSVVPSTEL